jgi:hypothetical protein
MILAPQVFSGNATVNATTPVAIGANGSLWAVEVQATAAQWAPATVTLDAQLGTADATPVVAPATLGVMASLNHTAIPTPLQTYLQFATGRYSPAFERVALAVGASVIE